MQQILNDVVRRDPELRDRRDRASTKGSLCFCIASIHVDQSASESGACGDPRPDRDTNDSKKRKNQWHNVQ